MKQTVRLFFAAALLAALFACKVPEPVVESTHVPDPTPISEEAVALATPEMTPVPTPAPTAEPSPEPTPEPTPEPIPSVWIFGREIACDTETLDLSDTESPSPDELSAALPYLKNLKAVALGERDPELAASFRAAFPDLDITAQYRFTYLGKKLDESTEELNLSRTKIADAEKLRRVLTWLPKLKHTELSGCGLPNETLAALRDEFPEKGIVWTVYLGYWGPLRTDATAFTTRSSKRPDEIKYRLTTGSASPIQYCTELVALDLGHQQIEDISCFKSLTKLQVLILADNQITDISALASMPDLIYVELFMNRISDLSPLSGLKNLKDLNICANRVKDLSPLAPLSSLERLWCARNPFTPEDCDALRAQLPDCDVNSTAEDDTLDGWRTHERYFWMRAFFENSPRYR